MNLRPLAYVALAGSAVLLAGCESFETVRDRDAAGTYASFDRPGLGGGHGRPEMREISANQCH